MSRLDDMIYTNDINKLLKEQMFLKILLMNLDERDGYIFNDIYSIRKRLYDIDKIIEESNIEHTEVIKEQIKYLQKFKQSIDDEILELNKEKQKITESNCEHEYVSTGYSKVAYKENQCKTMLKCKKCGKMAWCDELIIKEK